MDFRLILAKTDSFTNIWVGTQDLGCLCGWGPLWGAGSEGGGVRHGCFSYHFCEILDQSEYERIVDH